MQDISIKNGNEMNYYCFIIIYIISAILLPTYDIHNIQ